MAKKELLKSFRRGTINEMNTSYFRFYASLNDFLPSQWRNKTFPYCYESHQTVKHLIESMGVPHTQVSLILINGTSVGFERRVLDASFVSVYPCFHDFDVGHISKVLPPKLNTFQFVNDGHLGKLTVYMRLLGLDVSYSNDILDDELVEIAVNEGRILLTRDRGLLKRKEIVYGYWIHATDPREQVREVLWRYQLKDVIKPFTRCPRCNGILVPVEKEKILHLLEPKTKKYYNEFKICKSCSRIYWRGSHHDRISQFLSDTLESLSGGG